MSKFFSISLTLYHITNFDDHVRLSKIIWDIEHCLTDKIWQSTIAHQVQKADIHHTSVRILVKLHSHKQIIANQYQSITRYHQKSQCLNTTLVLNLDRYLNLPEHTARHMMCDDMMSYIKPMLIKYQNRVYHLDMTAFIPLLEQRIDVIKQGEFDDDFYQSSAYDSILTTQKILNQMRDDGLY